MGYGSYAQDPGKSGQRAAVEFDEPVGNSKPDGTIGGHHYADFRPKSKHGGLYLRKKLSKIVDVSGVTEASAAGSKKKNKKSVKEKAGKSSSTKKAGKGSDAAEPQTAADQAELEADAAEKEKIAAVEAESMRVKQKRRAKVKDAEFEKPPEPDAVDPQPAEPAEPRVKVKEAEFEKPPEPDAVDSQPAEPSAPEPALDATPGPGPETFDGFSDKLDPAAAPAATSADAPHDSNPTGDAEAFDGFEDSSNANATEGTDKAATVDGVAKGDDDVSVQAFQVATADQKVAAAAAYAARMDQDKARDEERKVAAAAEAAAQKAGKEAAEAKERDEREDRLRKLKEADKQKAIKARKAREAEKAAKTREAAEESHRLAAQREALIHDPAAFEKSLEALGAWERKIARSNRAKQLSHLEQEKQAEAAAAAKLAQAEKKKQFLGRWSAPVEDTEKVHLSDADIERRKQERGQSRFSVGGGLNGASVSRRR